MKKILFVFSLLSSIYSFGQLPPEFPKEVINKVFCCEVRTCGILWGGKVDCSYMNIFSAKIYFSEDEGLYVEYNFGEKWGKNNFGTTQKIKNFPLFKKTSGDVKDKYDDVVGKFNTYEYKIYGNDEDHCIESLTLSLNEGKDYFGKDAMPFSFSLKIKVPNHEKGLIFINPIQVKNNICGQIKSKAEIEKERQLIIQKEAADKLIVIKINKLLEQKLDKEAAIEYSNLNFENLEVKSVIQSALDVKFGSEEIILTDKKVNNYISDYSKSISKVSPNQYNLQFNKNGKCSIGEFPDLDYVPQENIGKFTVYKNSKTEIKLTIKDSILVSSTYSTSNTKPLFIDKKENFYFKSKTGLPVAKISIDPAIDKKLVRINKTYKREKYANGILIDTQEYKTEKTVGIMKKDQ
jgi:hypothetical protein